ncbi:beta-lactamase/transpeptidase-like protein [Globomyces pollinis-pini]|nr:beta-lactamase/transpeptidase-like protein [Globomyces pollinis-pini]
MTILGSLIEEKANLNLADYLQKLVYAPLNITQNGFPYEIVKRRKMDDLCYCAESSQYEPYDHLPYSSGGMISTTDDVAKFFIALLQNGQSLFKKSTTSEEFRKAPWYAKYFGSDGYRNGWEFETYKGVEMFTKGGNLMGFQSKAWIIPEFNEGGVFVSTSTGEFGLRDNAVQAFMELLHPDLQPDTTLPHLPVTVELNEISQRVAGVYSNFRTVYKGLSRILSLPASRSKVVLQVNSTLGSLDWIKPELSVRFFPVTIDKYQPENMMIYQAITDGKLKTWTAVFNGPINDSSSSVSYIGFNGGSSIIPVRFLDQPWVCYLMLIFELLSIVASAVLGIYSINYFRTNGGHGNYQSIPDEDGLTDFGTSECNSFTPLFWTGINILQLVNITFGTLILVVAAVIIGSYTTNPYQGNPTVLLTLFVSFNIMYTIGVILLALCILVFFMLKNSSDKVCPIEIALWACLVSFHTIGFIQTNYLNWFSFHFW